ncbi:sigma-70 family RNA polymerase sigma factor [Allosaccharopolyspora coralli]|uniref:RNA polymerase sigma factor n=1 Tax=Allosaccharopolyspora coralli TaxID=2665642 RepID=A0A5Q3Q5Q4_9PSEU|nr:sigma-70 family RNA polymerase sigma factor [Allosaccharopolyspora coralli]QGK68494.1 sigma-70 family RNA polymerase sigma factor [Allosaccharopolyspora coralli]
MTVATADDAFLAQIEPLRRELTAHCYRMVGSVHEAEDLVQETYLRAWRARDQFEERSSLRTWLYRIATNTCLTALRGAQRRPLPTGVGGPSPDARATLATDTDMPWLEPLPDTVVWSNAAPDPAEDVVTRDSVRLAFVAALQYLTAQQRAVVLLCDVLKWRAREAADALEVSVAAVNSSLQRARAQLAKVDAADVERLDNADDRVRDLLSRYVAAFESYDVTGIVALLTEDVVWEMPPFTSWFVGADAVRGLVEDQCPASAPGDMRMVPTSANGLPVLAVYERDEDGVHRAFQLQQLTVTAGGVSHVTCYFDTSLFAKFGLASELPPVP